MDFLDRLITALTETHPIHPMVVHFPIALSGAAALFILIALIKKDESFEKIAYAVRDVSLIGGRQPKQGSLAGISLCDHRFQAAYMRLNFL